MLLNMRFLCGRTGVNQLERKNNRIFLFCIITSLYWFSLYSYVPTFPTYTAGLGASYRMVGLVLGSYGFAQMVLRIPLGIVSDRLNRRKIFIFAGIAFSLISSLMLLVFKNIYIVLAARFMAGVAASSWVVFTVLFSSYFGSGEAPKAIGYINSFNSGGQMAAIFLGGAAAQFLGEQYPFLIGALVAFAALMLSLGIIENRDVKRKPATFNELLSVAANPAFLIICLLAVLSQFVTFATVYGFTPVAAEKIGANDFELGLLTGISTLPGIFASAMSGALFARKFGERSTIVGGFALSMITTVCIPFIGKLWVLYLTQFLGGFGRGLVFPLLMGLSIKNVEDSKRATAMGFFQAIYSIGMFLGPVLVGQLNQMVGLEWGFWCTGAVAFAGMLIMLLYRQKDRPASKSSE